MPLETARPVNKLGRRSFTESRDLSTFALIETGLRANMSEQLASDLTVLRSYLVQRARRFGLSRHDADDVVQDVIRSALVHARGLAGEDLRAWCRVVLKNRVFGLHRTPHAKPTVSVPDGHEMLERALMATQDHVVLLRQTLRVMAAMPARAARLTSIGIDDLTFEEAVEAERVALGTIKPAHHRVQGRLGEGLERPPRKGCA